MAKPKTVAKATLVSTDSNGNAVITTEGTKSAPGTRISNWWAFWGDGASYNGVNAPPTNLNYKYNKTGDFPFSLYVVDNKGYKAESPMIIVRISPPAPPTTPPSLLSVSPGSGAIGDPVVITGLNFGSSQGTSKVYFNGIQATVDSWSATSINCHVPVGATTGQVIVVVNNQSSNGIAFTVSGAATYDFIVANGGVDSAGTPGSLAQPFATIAYAIQRAAAVLSGTGKVIGVRGNGGNLVQVIQNPNAGGTSWTNKVRVVNYNGETVTVKPSAGSSWPVLMNFSSNQYIEFNGINLDGSQCNFDVVKIESLVGRNPNHIRFQNLTMIGHPSTDGGHGNNNGVLCSNTLAGAVGANEFLNVICHDIGHDEFDHGFYIAIKDCIVRDCEVYNATGSGFQVHNSEGILITGVQITNCKAHDNLPGLGGQHWGFIQGNNVSGTLWANCLAYNITGGTSGRAFQMLDGASTTLFFCLGYNCSSYGIRVEGGSGWTIQNSVMHTCGTNSQFDVAVTQNHNDFAGGADPGWTNAAAHDFTLLPGSRLKAAGVAVSVTTDILGNTRNNPPSIGPYE